MEKTALRGSDNYIWSVNDVLGWGSMGSVYVGRHRKTGDRYAIKVFNQNLRMLPRDYIAQELDALKRIPSHPNIVNIIAVELQKHTADSRVIVMELCEGGSLQDILHKPKNYFGLPEDDFLLVLFHIGNAIEYLLHHGIVHRDIKPGNILLSAQSDGSYVYKLTDFGTAKCFGEEETFSSIIGTEEYMHPDLHRDAFLDKKKSGCYSCGSDLWSFGVTIYQCATGQFPFVPQRGIKNDRQTMQTLVRHRDSGVISLKEEADGSLTSSTRLPNHCYLTSGTRKKVENLLAVLFDLKKCNKWRDFFKEFRLLQRQTKIYLFDVRKVSMYTVYLNQKACLSDLKQSILRCTGVPKEDQLLFWNMTNLDEEAVSTKCISEWLNTNEDRPLIMVAKTELLSRPQCQYKLKDLPDMPKPQADDVKWAREICGIIYFIEDCIKQQVTSQQHMLRTDILLRNCSDGKLILIKAEKSSLSNMLDLFKLLMAKSELGQVCLEVARKYLEEMDTESTSDRTVSPICVESRCWQEAVKMTKDAESLYDDIAKRSRSAIKHNDAEILKYNKSELRRSYRHTRNLASRHFSKEILCKHLDTSRRKYVLLIHLETKLHTWKLQAERVKSSLTAAPVDQLSHSRTSVKRYTAPSLTRFSKQLVELKSEVAANTELIKIYVDNLSRR